MRHKYKRGSPEAALLDDGAGEKLISWLGHLGHEASSSRRRRRGLRRTLWAGASNARRHRLEYTVGGCYFTVSTANSSVNKYGINKVLCIIYLKLTNSMSFIGFKFSQRDAHIPRKKTSFGAREN
jgi:hypothetical protein